MGKLVCTLQFSKTAGVTLTVENADDGITQTVTLDGTTLTIKVDDGSNTSTITQKADSIAIQCKDFSVDAETITCTAEKAAKHSSSGDVIELRSAKDMTLESSAKLVQKASSDVDISGANVSAKATSAATVKGASVTASASQKLTLEGQMGAALSGLTVDLKADGTLNAEASGIATLKGSVTNIQGSLVKAG